MITVSARISSRVVIVVSATMVVSAVITVSGLVSAVITNSTRRFWARAAAVPPSTRGIVSPRETVVIRTAEIPASIRNRCTATARASPSSSLYDSGPSSSA